MSFKITAELLKKIFKNTPLDKLKVYVEPINKVFADRKITDYVSVASFLAQVGHESGEFKFFVENLNYGAQGLLKTFPKYFNTQTAAAYARNPIRIASRVYANRFGNGDEASQDGWKYRGRGAIQITFKDNYESLAKSLDKTLDECIKYLETNEGAIVSAAWYFDSRSLWDEAKEGKLQELTKRINGGLNGYTHRKELFERAKLILKE